MRNLDEMIIRNTHSTLLIQISGASSHSLTLAEKLSGESLDEISRKRKEKLKNDEIEMAESKLCPYLLQGKCETPNCPFIHGLLCETCGLHCLIPDFPEQNEKHRKGSYGFIKLKLYLLLTKLGFELDGITGKCIQS